jgi:hypothetical protein
MTFQRLLTSQLTASDSIPARNLKMCLKTEKIVGASQLDLCKQHLLTYLRRDLDGLKKMASQNSLGNSVVTRNSHQIFGLEISENLFIDLIKRRLTEFSFNDQSKNSRKISPLRHYLQSDSGYSAGSSPRLFQLKKELLFSQRSHGLYSP